MNFSNPVNEPGRLGFGPWTPPAPTPGAANHPLAYAGVWMALGSIMSNFDSINGLEMAWDDSTVVWGNRVSSITTAEDEQLNQDYTDLSTYINDHSKNPPDDFNEQVTKLQLKYQNDQTQAQNSMQQPQAQLDKQTNAAKNLGTVTQQGLQNAQSLLSIESNLSQAMSH